VVDDRAARVPGEIRRVERLLEIAQLGARRELLSEHLRAAGPLLLVAGPAEAGTELELVGDVVGAVQEAGSQRRG
jgi:hypothetical protein